MVELGKSIWLIGLPSCGKTTLAEMIACDLSIVHLDSDKLREYITPNTIYAKEDREIIYRCIIQICSILNMKGLDVIVSATANLEKYRNMAAQKIDNNYFIYLKCPIQICEKRDNKNFYKFARDGIVKTLPIRIEGVNDSYVDQYYSSADVYEEPQKPDYIVDTSINSIDDSYHKIKQFIDRT